MDRWDYEYNIQIHKYVNFHLFINKINEIIQSSFRLQQNQYAFHGMRKTVHLKLYANQ